MFSFFFFLATQGGIASRSWNYSITQSCGLETENVSPFSCSAILSRLKQERFEREAYLAELSSNVTEYLCNSSAIGWFNHK